MKVKRIFAKNGTQEELLTDLPSQDPTDCAKVVIFRGQMFEFFMYTEGKGSVDWEFMYSPLKGEAHVGYSLTEIENLDAVMPKHKCDCGADAVGGLHSNWCSVREDNF